MEIQHWFALGMKRHIPELLAPSSPHLDLGTRDAANRVPFSFTTEPAWRAPGRIERLEGGVEVVPGAFGAIWAHHFFEHLAGDDVVMTLGECARLLRVGGTLNIVTPYYSSQMQAHDLDHKSQFCEATWANLLNNQYYSPPERRLPFRVHACFILGIVERNNALFTQLERTE